MKRFFLGLAALAFITSCDNNDNADMPNTLDLTSTSESIVTTEAQLDDVVEAADYEIDLFTGTEENLGTFAAQSNESTLKAGTVSPHRLRYKWNKCPEINISSEEGGFPKTITLNYGESTELENGRVISGIIQIVISGPRRENGSTRTVTYDNFSVDSIGIEGTNVKTFLRDEYKIKIVRDMTFTLPDGTTIDRDANRIKTKVEGMETPFDHADDVFYITGGVKCEDSDGNTYERTITEDLVKKGGCRFIVAGEVNITKNGVWFATINYGDGECDREATMITEEETKTFTIGKRKRIKKVKTNN